MRSCQVGTVPRCSEPAASLPHVRLCRRSQLDAGRRLIDTPEAFVLKVELAGMKPEDVHIELEDDVLTIRGERQQEESSRRSSTRARSGTTEHSGAASRCPRVKRDAIEATYENGVVEVRVPKAAEVEPQRIELKPKGKGSVIDTEQAA